MAENFKATSESMQQAATELNTARDELRHEVTQTSQKLEQLTQQGFKTPRASAAFQEYVRAWNGAISELYGRLQDVSQAITETSQGIEQRDQALTQGVQGLGGGAGGAGS